MCSFVLIHSRILDAVHFAFGTHAVYFYVITNYMNALALEQENWYATVKGCHSALLRIDFDFVTRSLASDMTIAVSLAIDAPSRVIALTFSYSRA